MEPVLLEEGSLWGKEFVKKVGFKPRVKERRSCVWRGSWIDRGIGDERRRKSLGEWKMRLTSSLWLSSVAPWLLPALFSPSGGSLVKRDTTWRLVVLPCVQKSPLLPSGSAACLPPNDLSSAYDLRLRRRRNNLSVRER